MSSVSNVSHFVFLRQVQSFQHAAFSCRLNSINSMRDGRQQQSISCDCEGGRPLVCRNKLDGPYDNRVLPIVLSVVMIVALSITFVSSIVSFEQSG